MGSYKCQFETAYKIKLTSPKGNAMLNVLDHACNIFACFSKKTVDLQSNKIDSSRANAKLRCGKQTRSGSTLINHSQINQSENSEFGKVGSSSPSEAVEVGARFGKYYLEMIANLDESTEPAPISFGALQTETSVTTQYSALDSLKLKSFTRIRSLDLGNS